MLKDAHLRENTCIIILAAGASTRLGFPKQMVSFNGRTLLQHTVEAALSSDIGPVVVVLGAFADEIGVTLESYDELHIVTNNSFSEGLSSSIKSGLRTALLTIENLEGVVLMLCDQPCIDSSILTDLIGTHVKTGLPIVSCDYGEKHGPPTYINKTFFKELLILKGDLGAKSLLSKYHTQVAWTPFLNGDKDVDFPEDLDSLPSFI